MSQVFIEAFRDAYCYQDCPNTMTVAELIEYLRTNFNDEDEIYLRFNNGYTFGALTERRIVVNEDEDQ